MEEEKVTRPRRSRPLSERRETATRQKGEPRRLPSPTCRSCRSTSSVCDGQRPCKTCIELGPDTQKTCVRPGRKSTACDTCRSWNKRCDSVKPICGSCTKADKSCIWERKLKHTHIPITRAGTVSETVAAGGSRLADSAGTEWSPDDVTTNTISKKPLESEFDHVGIVTEGEMEEKEQDAGSDDAEEEATSITQHSQSSAGGQSEPGEIVSEVMGYGGGPVYTSIACPTLPSIGGVSDMSIEPQPRGSNSLRYVCFFDCF